MTNLNKDVLFIILTVLASDKKWNRDSILTGIEKKSLHSCLFVNRLWCETVVPILWSNPWKFVTNNKMLFNVITSFLSKESLNFLSRQGINLLPTLHEYPLFDYISYCKYITFHGIKSCVNEVKFDKQYQNHAMKQEIYKLFISKCSALKFLEVMNVKTHLRHPIYYFPGVELSLREITFLYCDSSIDSAFFYELSYVCKLLQEIYITSYPNDNLGLARLIEVQKNLKCFICSINSDDNRYVAENEEIGNALIQQADSLIEFTLIYEDNFIFPLNIFLNFNNLQKLKLLHVDDHDYHDYRLEEQLESLKFPKLRVFNIGIIKLKRAIKIIEKTDGNLSKVLLAYSVYEEEYSGKYIRTIYKHCPNIRTLSLGINNNDYIEFENLLKKCQLERIIIERSFPKKASAKLLFEILSRSAPKTLREIRIFSDWIITQSDLESFFENWRGRNPIFFYLFVDDYIGINEGTLKVLKNYKNEGVIKNYRYNSDCHEFYLISKRIYTYK